jgi:hypothetical protein
MLVDLSYKQAGSQKLDRNDHESIKSKCINTPGAGYYGAPASTDESRKTEFITT